MWRYQISRCVFRGVGILVLGSSREPSLVPVDCVLPLPALAPVLGVGADGGARRGGARESWHRGGADVASTSDVRHGAPYGGRPHAYPSQTAAAARGPLAAARA